MTVIAAIPRDDHVIMASDTALMRRDTYIADVDKISVMTVGPDHEQPALLGISGSRALADLARRDLDERANLPHLTEWQDPDKADRWALTIAAELVRIAVKAEQPLLVDDTEADAEALLAFGPHLWLLSGHAAVRLAEPFAIGSGADAARGALYVAEELGLATNYPHDALRLAVCAAIKLDAHCGGEIRIKDTAPECAHVGVDGEQ